MPEVWEDFVRISKETPNPLQVFQESWNRGVAVIYKLPMNLKADWSPGFFSRNYGHESSEIEDCLTKERQYGSIASFFDGFEAASLRIKDTSGKPLCLKLPDWPTNTDFKSKFPKHFQDFKSLIPFPMYTAQQGSRNLAARLPAELVPSDLGPKMYCAYASSDEGSLRAGTTPLHLDMADAVNVMVYASDPADSELAMDARPSAVWDIFPRSALVKLRRFVGTILKERGRKYDDPIHDQTFFMTASLRERLFKETGGAYIRSAIIGIASRLHVTTLAPKVLATV
ncbi:putative JmjC domain-containing histone demethylation protein 2C [Dinochytrium kinnereticum]|nr:putative JmjC domain-containing histone demethylation protein 2C [Dinochytrium kinnereticum]